MTVTYNAAVAPPVSSLTHADHVSELSNTPAHDAPTTTDLLPDGKALREQYQALLLRLSQPLSNTERAELKQDIIALFRDVTEATDQYARLKEAVKALASQWKSVTADPTGTVQAGEGTPFRVTPPTATPSMIGHVDHLGASTFIEKGWSKLSLGDAAGAEVALRKALALAPNDNDAECLLGWALMHQQQYDSALLIFHNVLMRDPQHALTRTNVGFVCLRKGIYGEAIEHLSRAIRSNTDRKATLYAHLYLGMVYREREMYDDAQLFFSRALELGPNLLEAWYESGRAYWLAGKFEEARASWRQGANANKFNPWGKRCAEILMQVDQEGSPPQRD